MPLLMASWTLSAWTSPPPLCLWRVSHLVGHMLLRCRQAHRGGCKQQLTESICSGVGLLGEVERLQEHEVLQAILDQGSDVRAFGRQYDSQLRSAELESIQDYILEADNLQLLHGQVSSTGCLKQAVALPPLSQRLQATCCCCHACTCMAVSWCAQIEECDQVLGSMEAMLGRFQADLGNVSGEIRSLQVQHCCMRACHEELRVLASCVAAAKPGRATGADVCVRLVAGTKPEHERQIAEPQGSREQAGRLCGLGGSPTLPHTGHPAGRG